MSIEKDKIQHYLGKCKNIPNDFWDVNGCKNIIDKDGNEIVIKPTEYRQAKYFSIMCYISARIESLSSGGTSEYIFSTNYETLANLMNIGCKEPREIRRKVNKLLYHAECLGHIGFEIKDNLNKINIVSFIKEPNPKKGNYTCIPLTLIATNKITIDMKMYLIALIKTSFHRGVSRATTKELSKFSYLSPRSVQNYHVQADKEQLIKYIPSKGGFTKLSNGTVKGHGRSVTSELYLLNEETDTYYFMDKLKPRKKLVKKSKKKTFIGKEKCARGWNEVEKAQ